MNTAIVRIRSLRLAILATVIVGGCFRPGATPTRQIKSPDGGPPVWTATERAASKNVAALTSYEPRTMPPPTTKIKPIEQWTETETAADALGRIGAPAIPALVQTLQNADPEVRLKATAVLGRIGPEAKDAVQDLIRLLDDPDERVRKAAARTLGRIGPAAGDAVPGLMRSLFEPSPHAPG